MPSPSRRPRRPRTLRSRLVLTTSLLLVAVGLVIGGVTAVALHLSLTGRVDAQLDQAVDRGRRDVGDPGPGGQGGPPGSVPAAGRCVDGTVPAFRGPGPTDGTLYARFAGGDLLTGQSGVLDEPRSTAGNPCVRPLTGAQARELEDVADDDGRKRTVDLEGLGRYRVVSTTLPDGSRQVSGVPLADVDRTLLTVVGVEVAAILGGVAVAAGAGSVLVRRDLLPLQRVANTAARVSELELDRGEVDLSLRVPDADGSTEVGKVALALNRMLDNVGSALEARHASEQRVRQFVADASHELRTPLAAIRGYSELTRRSRDVTGGQVPADVLHAMGRVESEALRMTGLVEDLLLLARLDSGRPLDRGPVDLTMTVLDAVSDAQVAGRDHRWQLDLPEEAVEVVGDAGRLHQVLANLLANARTHTPPGTTVTVGIVPDGAVAHVDVVDDGPGIAPEVLPRVFERFVRADSSRSRVAGSTGLGLAIVQAVVASHHGTVTVDSRPGRTAFRVTLPTT
ncbi:sensor histidine kinase [Kineococcus radiotolerans]|uniref:histidine kinase n=1 Tax=Kineococcus radiotolerans (strain ATCC BAA-149 / DSM 14245 / SRS30216) TaxID=266940 RepID=A6WCG2_KINRD|nr:HAMP domain-containing sensor histidine kinase [Kineococcus radiotolerans]ABS04501.1 integral membrane sensor signal transduction histidine kinase [Kineococcus radiotolerans SRS30216 = ATCC BAA-149]